MWKGFRRTANRTHSACVQTMRASQTSPPPSSVHTASVKNSHLLVTRERVVVRFSRPLVTSSSKNNISRRSRNVRIFSSADDNVKFLKPSLSYFSLERTSRTGVFTLDKVRRIIFFLFFCCFFFVSAYRTYYSHFQNVTYSTVENFGPEMTPRYRISSGYCFIHTHNNSFSQTFWIEFCTFAIWTRFRPNWNNRFNPLLASPPNAL